MNKDIGEMDFTEEERELYRDIWEGLGIQDYWDECIWKKVRVENCSLALIRKGYRKRKVGQWDTVKITAYCSSCGFGRNIEKQIGWKFCPNCGANMEGEEG